MSRIIELRSENVKRLKAIQINPTGNLVIVGGRNGQGKSSALESILMALGGAKEIPEQPIRAGETRAQIVLKTSDGLMIKRVFTAAGSTLVVENSEGMSAKAPQQIIDKLTGKLAFDPVAFQRLDATKQREALKALVALDFSEDDRHRASLFSERTVVGRQVADASSVLNSMPQIVPVPEGPVLIDETIAELDRAEATNLKAKELAEAATTAANAVLDARQEDHEIELQTKEIEAEIARLQEALATIVKARGAKATEIADLQAKATAAEKLANEAPTVEVQPIKDRLASAERINNQIRANNAREAQQKVVQDLNAKHAELTKAIEHIDAEKQRKLKEAKFPVEGLSFDDRGVTFNGFPFSQASSADQLRVSVAMGAALNPRLRIMIVKDGSLLDEDSLAQLAKMAEELDCQVWLERVGKGSECSVVIEDGQIEPAKENAA